ncbi:MAG: hypothetical protein H7138_11945 [Myxococcales bacterium]|nr:hypothetical protein [Myxococcales bacterium]
MSRSLVRTIMLLGAAVLSACSSSGEGATVDAAGGDDAPIDARGGTGGPDDAQREPGEPAELAGITRAHNDVRARVATATALPPMAWDDALAATAAAYLPSCVDRDGNGLIDHNPDRAKGHAFLVGENIFASTGTATAAAAVGSWADEQRYYQYADNTCVAGKVCGHYTQVVWRDSVKIGCAIHRCANLRYASTILCDYGPAGNVGRDKPY